MIRVTTHWADDRYPAWSPDGRWLAFSSNRDGPWEVYVTLADGSGPSLPADLRRRRAPGLDPLSPAPVSAA